MVGAGIYSREGVLGLQHSLPFWETGEVLALLEIVEYYAARSKFERFRGFCGINEQIRIQFSSLRKLFSERFEFLVCSKFNHMQRDCTCACAVACLYPHNSISNVVVTLTIHDNIFFDIQGDLAKKHESIVEGQRLL